MIEISQMHSAGTFEQRPHFIDGWKAEQRGPPNGPGDGNVDQDDIYAVRCHCSEHRRYSIGCDQETKSPSQRPTDSGNRSRAPRHLSIPTVPQPQAVVPLATIKCSSAIDWRCDGWARRDSGRGWARFSVRQLVILSITIASAFEATVLLIGVGIIVWGIISATRSAGME